MTCSIMLYTMLANSYKSFKKAGGFSLIEVLIALTIFAIAALGTSVLSITAIRANASNALRVKATSAIQDKIESLRLEVKAGRAITSGSDTIDGIGRSWVVFNDQPSIGLKTITVEIRWAQAPIKDARFLKYSSVLGAD